MSAAPQSDAAITTTADLLLARRDDSSTALRSGDDSWTWREFVTQCAIRAAALPRWLPCVAQGPGMSAF